MEASSTGTSTITSNPNPDAGTGTPASVTPTIAAVTGERFYDAAGNLVGIKDGTGTTIFIGSVTAHTSTTNVKTATCTYTFAGKTVAQRTVTAAGSKLAFIIGDTVNTAQTMTMPTTGTGPLTTLTRYTDPLGLARAANATATANTAYGAATAATAGTGSNASSSEGFSAVNGYISGLDDTASALTHLGARDLDPVIGTFTTPDPILNTEDQRGFTPYTYAFGNVINTSDPSGLKPTCDCEDDQTGKYAQKPAWYQEEPPPPATPFLWWIYALSPRPVVATKPAQVALAVFADTGAPTVQDAANLGMGPMESVGFGLSLTAGSLGCFTSVGVCLSATGGGIAAETAGRAADGKQVDLASAGGEAAAAAAMAIPCKGFCRVIGAVGGKLAAYTIRPLSRIEAATLTDALRPNNLRHVFDPKHNFQPLVAKYGTEEAAMEQLVRRLDGPDLPVDGKPFQVKRIVDNQAVVIRGQIVDGVPRIGTAFTP